MKRNRRSILVGATAVAAAVGIAFAIVPAFAAARGGDGGHAREGGGVTYLLASLRGANEVPVAGKPAVGDPDGAALEFVRIKGATVTFAVKWRGTGRPTMLHIHQGVRGVNGDVKVDFSEQLGSVRGGGGWQRAAGSVTVKDTALLASLKRDPGAFYANLHTAEFPGGAVRGQLREVGSFDLSQAVDGGVRQASVVRGRQVYECKKGADGTTAFAQRDVAAVLDGGIRHTFTAPHSGTPQWLAPDASAVTGKVLTKSPNGDGNIPELDLKATRSGARHGLLAGADEVLRLNTVGGVAPVGACSTGAVVGVPYRADYVFIDR
ncbi:CHRD domain-containing protein [Streptomyces sp. NPDC020719]|uniref:CHRD domain-containing protein n=1 Tax=Streptomyces sp. NPDC020719 TaxID=3154896 RepID=UPI0033C718F5